MKKLKLLSILMLVAIVASACGTPAATQAPAATGAPAGTQSPVLSAGNLANVAREDTVVLGWSISSPIGVTNPWAVPGYTHQEGNVFLWEALEYYGIFGSSEIPWLADSMD